MQRYAQPRLPVASLSPTCAPHDSGGRTLKICPSTELFTLAMMRRARQKTIDKAPSDTAYPTRPEQSPESEQMLQINRRSRAPRSRRRWERTAARAAPRLFWLVGDGEGMMCTPAANCCAVAAPWARAHLAATQSSMTEAKRIVITGLNTAPWLAWCQANAE